MNNTIGIDVSKDWLDAFGMARAEHRRFANDGKGLRALHRWIITISPSLVVFEGLKNQKRPQWGGFLKTACITGDWKAAFLQGLFHIPR